MKQNYEKPIEAKLSSMDTANDIALLIVENGYFPDNDIFVIAENVPNVGEDIYTVGFPLIGSLGIKPSYTNGSVSANSGIMNDPRYFQISVPIQPGNSGGPLMNKKNYVVGIIAAKLSDVNTLRESGALPQNVNFAVKAHYILALAKTSKGWRKHAKNPQKTIDDVLNSVVLVVCQTR